MHFHSDMRININRNICTASVCSFKFPYKFLHVLYSYGVVKFQCTVYNLAQFFRHITVYAAKGQLLLSGTSEKEISYARTSVVPARRRVSAMKTQSRLRSLVFTLSRSFLCIKSEIV